MSKITYEKLDADHWSMKSSDAPEHLEFDCRILRDEENGYLATSWVFGDSEPFASRWVYTLSEAREENIDSLDVAKGMVS